MRVPFTTSRNLAFQCFTTLATRGLLVDMEIELLGRRYGLTEGQAMLVNSPDGEGLALRLGAGEEVLLSLKDPALAALKGQLLRTTWLTPVENDRRVLVALHHAGSTRSWWMEQSLNRLCRRPDPLWRAVGMALVAGLVAMPVAAQLLLALPVVGTVLLPMVVLLPVLLPALVMRHEHRARRAIARLRIQLETKEHTPWSRAA